MIKNGPPRTSRGKTRAFLDYRRVSDPYGSWIAGHLERVLGVTDTSFYGTLFVAFLLILFGGLAWIAVAVGVAQHGKGA